MKETTKGSWNAFGVILVCIIAGTLMWLNPGCTSQSSKEMNTQPEKVVIIDAIEGNTSPHFPTREYKVKRLNKGVVLFITAKKGYDVGDTILVRIPN